MTRFALVLCAAAVVLLAAAAGRAAAQGIESIITQSVFDNMLKQRNNAACPAKGFYTYDAFVTAARAFPAFGTTGDLATRKRELAAFFGETSHETTGGTRGSADQFEWGYCFKEEQAKKTDPTFYGRGPIQLTHRYNYEAAGKALHVDLVGNPNLVATDPVVSFKTAVWFWMTAQANKPSCHDVITGRWTPTAADRSAGRTPGYGVITNIINGGVECGMGPNVFGEDRIGFYKRYCGLLGTGYGSNLDCYNQKNFSQT